MNDLAYETIVLEEKVGQLIGTLRGTGLGEGEIQRALQVEAGQCAWKIATELGPKSSQRAKQILNSEVHSQLNEKPRYIKFTEDQQYSSAGDFTWLYAGPNFIAGINDEDNRPDASGEEALAAYRAKSKRGVAWLRVGTTRRGHQAVMILNRVRVSKESMMSVRNVIGAKFGQAKASFARTAVQYLHRTFNKKWVTDKIPTVIANGKSILDDAGLKNLNDPFLDFGSRAPGVTTNPKMLAAIRAGVISSQATLSKKCQQIVKGLTYNWNTGQVFGKTKFEDN